MVGALADDLVRFVQTHLGSVWALKLMLTLMREPDRSWTVEALVRELRASSAVISPLLSRFVRIGLAIETDGDWTWRPATPEMEELAGKVAHAYAVTPFGVIQAIAEAPEDRIRGFADAFRLRKD
jgi:hypothetical protein